MSHTFVYMASYISIHSCMYSSTHSATYISIYSSIYSTSRVLEDTIDTPTCSNGVLPSRTPLTSQPAAMVSCRHPSFLSLSLCRPLFPSLVLSLSLSLSLYLSLCLSFILPSPSVIVSSHLWLCLSLLCFLPSLSLARALAHAPGLFTSRVLEDTIDTPTGSNGVQPSLFVSLSLSVFFSFCFRAIFDPSLFSRSLSLSRARSRSCCKAHP